MALLTSAYVGGAFVVPGLANEPAPQSTASAATSPAPSASPFRLAPADEYFGLSRMSVLEIANRLRDLAAAYDVRRSDAEATLSGAALTVDALRDWEHHYPADRWLPRSLFALERLYARLPTAQARNQFWQVAHWLDKDYPASPEAAFCRREMAAHVVLDPPRAGQIYAVANPHQSPPSQVAVGPRAAPTPRPIVPRAWRKLALPAVRPTLKPAPASRPSPKPPAPATHSTPKAEPAARAEPKPAAPVVRTTSKPAQPPPTPKLTAPAKPPARPKPAPSPTVAATPPGGDVPRF